jgi:hypothetical protein
MKRSPYLPMKVVHQATGAELSIRGIHKPQGNSHARGVKPCQSAHIVKCHWIRVSISQCPVSIQ